MAEPAIHYSRGSGGHYKINNKMAQVPAKIVLKSTTRMSLNDRFTNIQKSRPAVSVQNIRAKMAAQQQASVRNRRLAQQMANRPSVIAALKIKRRSLKQRLGKSNVKSRLSLSVMRGRGGRSRSRGGRFRGRGLNMSMRGMPNRGRGSNLSRQQSALSLGMGGPGNMDDGRNMSLLQGRGRGRGLGRFRGRQRFRGGRGGGPYSSRFRGGRGGGRSRGGRGGGGRFRSGRGSQRGMRGGRGRGGSRVSGSGGGTGGNAPGGPPGSGGNPQLVKQELDNQLDEYMSKTKAHLDAELDAYMAQANES